MSRLLSGPRPESGHLRHGLHQHELRRHSEEPREASRRVSSDLTVNCGSSYIFLTINICPTLFAMYDPLLLALNGNHNQSNCLGKLDNSSSPPVVSYAFPLNDTTQNACGNVIQIQDEAGSGIFNDFSTIQTVVLSGFVSTPSIASSGTISYSTSLYYNFSCHYPLQYLINQTRLSTYSVSVAVNTNNGSFISTLSMKLFLDANFSMTLDQNGTALPLKTRIYVQIDATGLAANFNVLLDQCFATPTMIVTSVAEDRHQFLTGCSIQDRTEVFANGNSKRAQFSFETFRFIKYVNQKPCTIFLHCITRLCQPEQCAQFLQGCSQGTNVTGSARRKRASAKASTAPLEGTSSSVTVSSGPIYTVDEASTGIGPSSGSLFGLLIGLIIAVILSTGLIVASITTYKLYHLRATQAALKYAVNSGSNGQGIYMIPTMQPQPL
ncbi:hypothetical protein NDU88_006015 [Pleurodeles waltl]|uniref:ZP domain-containing protein n=1 Tax=Pleurodeles waltl TaxID=8319 RepID=A0AAV7UJS1_PLEWA|nr:hypothetical protein NDU88_006015 [Pleurodeles waltl]